MKKPGKIIATITLATILMATPYGCFSPAAHRITGTLVAQNPNVQNEYIVAPEATGDTVLPSPTETIKATPTPTYEPTPTPTNTTKPTPTSAPTPTPAPVPRPTPTLTDSAYIDTSVRHTYRLKSIEVDDFTKQLIKEIVEVSKANSASATQMYIEFSKPNCTKEYMAKLRQLIYAYLYSYYFPTVMPPILDNNYSLSFPDFGYSYGELGRLVVGYVVNENEGKCYLVFIPKQINECIQKHRKNIQKIDQILDAIPNGSETEVASAIANKLMSMAVYNANYPDVQDLLYGGKASCYSFTCAYMAACRRVGIRCSYKEGKYGSTPHAWNVITFSTGQKLYYDLARAKSNGSSCLAMPASAMGSYTSYSEDDYYIYWGFPW